MTSSTAWSGRVGEVWAEEWPRTERAFSDLEPHLEAAILAVAPQHGRFLDIGCGVGATGTAVALARPAATVTGVDLSAQLVAVARSRAAVPNARFVHADALDHAEAEGPFDLLFSRHGVMFFADPAAAFRRLRGTAVSGAPIVFSCFAAPSDNPWATLLGAQPSHSTSYVPGPFAFAESAVGETFLTTAGWRDPVARRVDFSYRAGGGDDPIADAVAFFTRIGPAASAIRDAAPDDRPALRARLADRIAPFRRGDTVSFPAAAWIWSARA